MLSVKDIAYSTKVIPGFLASGSSMAFFRESKFPIYQMIYAKSQAAMSYQEGLARVRRDPNYAFFMESHVFDYELQKNPCDLYKVGDEIRKAGFGFAFEKGSPLRAQFNSILLRLHEDQTMVALHYKHWYNKSKCAGDTRAISDIDASTEAPVRSLGVEGYSGVVVLLGVGLLLSLTVAGFEASMHRRKEHTIV